MICVLIVLTALWIPGSVVSQQSVLWLSPQQRVFVNGVPVDPKAGHQETVFLVRGGKRDHHEDSPISLEEPDLRRVPKEKTPTQTKFASRALLESYKKFGKEKKKESEVKPIVEQIEKELKEWDRLEKMKLTTPAPKGSSTTGKGGKGAGGESSTEAMEGESSTGGGEEGESTPESSESGGTEGETTAAGETSSETSSGTEAPSEE